MRVKSFPLIWSVLKEAECFYQSGRVQLSSVNNANSSQTTASFKPLIILVHVLWSSFELLRGKRVCAAPGFYLNICLQYEMFSQIQWLCETFWTALFQHALQDYLGVCLSGDLGVSPPRSLQPGRSDRLLLLQHVCGDLALPAREQAQQPRLEWVRIYRLNLPLQESKELQVNLCLCLPVSLCSVSCLCLQVKTQTLWREEQNKSALKMVIWCFFKVELIK